MSFIITKSLQSQMLEDFELERQECLKIGNTRRLSVIEASVRELREQMKNPSKHEKMIHGGYSDEELRRIESMPRWKDGV